MSPTSGPLCALVRGGPGRPAAQPAQLRPAAGACRARRQARCSGSGVDRGAREECDSCARMWCDPPSPLADAQLEDAADGNRQTVKPKFWWRDLDDEEGARGRAVTGWPPGLDALVRQVHMQEEGLMALSRLHPQEAPMVMQGEAPHSGARSPQHCAQCS